MITRQNFAEIGNAVTDGYSLFHLITYQHPEEECLGWQHGIHNFCDWLDKRGYLVVVVPASQRLRVRVGKFLIGLGEFIATWGERHV